MPATLILVVPGLLGPWTGFDITGLPQPRSVALERLLARARVSRVRGQSVEEALFALFHLPRQDGHDLPIAPITRLIDGGGVNNGWWLRADPVYLHADLDKVLLFDARQLDIGVAEAQALTAEFNRVFSGDGLTLLAPEPNRWYLRLEADPGIGTHSLMDAIGRNIHPLLPQGNASGRWHGLLTEIQMLFHDSRVNLDRQSRGQAPVNSVWFWGGGRLPAGAISPAKRVYASDILTRGLGRLAGVPVDERVPKSGYDWCQVAGDEDDSLVMLDHACYDPVDENISRWLEHIEMLECEWFMPCLEMLVRKQLLALHLYPCNGYVFVLRRMDLMAFWRRIRRLSHYC